jgi:hypothetical protein
MPKVSTQVQRRIAELDAQYTVTQPKGPRRIGSVVALIILAIIAVTAFSYANHTTSDFTRLTLKQGTMPNRQLSDAEAQAKWDATWKTVSTGFKGGE